MSKLIYRLFISYPLGVVKLTLGKADCVLDGRRAKFARHCSNRSMVNRSVPYVCAGLPLKSATK